MKLQVSRSKTIKELQVEFATCFPNLKIEFFASTHKPEQGSFGKLQFPRTMKLGELSPMLNEGEIAVSPGMRTGHLEQVLHAEFGLNAQVFRNMNGTWIQSTNSDDLSLLEQNEIAQASIPKKSSMKNVEERDY